MPVQLNVTFNDGGAVAALEGMRGRLGNLRPAMDEIGQALQTSTHQRFLDAEDPEGRPWPELSAATKAKRGSDAKPLRDRGNLFDSINWRAGAAEVAVGSIRKYARLQQLGGQAGRGRKVTIPPRPYLGINEDDRQEITDILRVHLGD